MRGEVQGVGYRAFYPGATSEYILNADAKRFPIRDNADEAVRDAQLFWHREGEHITPYRIDADGTVTQLEARVRRVHQVEVAKP